MNLPQIAEFLQIIRLMGYPALFILVLYFGGWFVALFLIYPTYIFALDIYDVFRSRHDYLILHESYVEFSDFSQIERINPRSLSLWTSESYRPSLRNKDNKWQLSICPVEKDKDCVHLDLEGMNLSGYVGQIKKVCSKLYGEKFSIENS